MEEKKPRSLDEIKKEFGDLLIRSGQIQYQIFVSNQDLALINEQMKELNFEAASVPSTEKSKEESK